MKKKIIAALFAVAATFCAAAAVSGCDGLLHQHSYTENVKNPTCTEGGYTRYVCECGNYYDVDFTDPAGHVAAVDEKKEADCSSSGLTEGSHCSVCLEVLVPQQVIPANGNHKAVVDKAVEPFCGNTGLTEGSHCDVCGKVFTEQQVLPAPSEHVVAVDSAVSATCTKDGLSEGSHCEVCGKVFTAQKVIPKGHSWQDNVCTYCKRDDGGSRGLIWRTTASGLAYVTGAGNCADAEIVIPETHNGMTVRGIDSGAFKDCKFISAITLPDNLYKVEDGAFEGCTSLKKLTADLFYSEIYDTVLLGIEELTVTGILSSYKLRNFSELRILTVVKADSFSGYDLEANELLESITVGEDCAEVSSYGGALYNKDRTELLFVPKAYNGELVVCDGVKRIDFSSEGFANITSLVIPDGVDYISPYAFRNMSGLKKVALPVSAMYIANNNSPEEIKIISGDSVNSLTFRGVDGLKNLTLGSAVTLVDTDALRDMTGLRTVTIEGENVTIGNNAFRGCSSLTRFRVTGSVLSLGDNAFYDCTALTYADLREGLDSIGSCAFANCYSLKEAALPESVKEIGYNAFCYCKGLQKFSFPNTTKIIPSGILLGCSGLKSVTVPDGAVTIGDDAFGDCSGLTEIEIPQSVTDIGSSVFNGCSALKTVALPDGLETVEDFLFEHSGITSVVIPSKVTVIGENAFAYCESLVSVTFVGAVENIKTEAFTGCTALTEIEFPKSLRIIDSYAFENCDKLGKIVLNDGLSRIDSFAFSGCKSLVELVIPQSVVELGSRAFYGCTNLSDVRIETKTAVVPSDIFYNTPLTEIEFVGSVSEWENMLDVWGWDNGITVHCSDGNFIGES